MLWQASHFSHTFNTAQRPEHLRGKIFCSAELWFVVLMVSLLTRGLLQATRLHGGVKLLNSNSNFFSSFFEIHNFIHRLKEQWSKNYLIRLQENQNKNQIGNQKLLDANDSVAAKMVLFIIYKKTLLLSICLYGPAWFALVNKQCKVTTPTFNTVSHYIFIPAFGSLSQIEWSNHEKRRVK